MFSKLTCYSGPSLKNDFFPILVLTIFFNTLISSSAADGYLFYGESRPYKLINLDKKTVTTLDLSKPVLATQKAQSGHIYFLILDFEFSGPLNKLFFHKNPFFVLDFLSPLILARYIPRENKMEYIQRIQTENFLKPDIVHKIFFPEPAYPTVVIGNSSGKIEYFSALDNIVPRFLGEGAGDFFFQILKKTGGQVLFALKGDWFRKRIKSLPENRNISSFCLKEVDNSNLAAALILENQYYLYWIWWEPLSQSVSNFFSLPFKYPILHMDFDAQGNLWFVEEEVRETGRKEEINRIEPGKRLLIRENQYYQALIRIKKLENRTFEESIIYSFPGKEKRGMLEKTFLKFPGKEILMNENDSYRFSTGKKEKWQLKFQLLLE
ncbi:hypothetical protein ACFL35_02610 [Candidatus Riflebacteria bacterium]